MNKYKNFKINENLTPEILVIKNNEKNKNLNKIISKYNFKEVLKNDSFTILIKKN